MEMKFAQCVNKGMQRDYAMNTASQEFAYENKNIRITTSGNESFLAITNERSTEKITDINKDFELTFNRIKLLGTKIMSTYPVNSDVYLYLYSANEFEINELGKRVRKKYKACIKQGETEADTGDIDLNSFPLWGFEVISDYRKDFKYYYLSYNYSYDLETDVESLIPEYPDSSLVHINMEGEVLGTAVINNYLILFNHDNNNNLDYIYRITINDYVEVDTVYQGKLGFNPEYPIECITSYESEDVQKVYWVDGFNQPRVINICKLNQTPLTTNLDFVPKIEGDIKVEINKKYDGSGSFPSGVIQYYITYYNKFGQESNAVYVSPLYMISSEIGGGNEDDIHDCSFELLISNVDRKYDYIRVYSFIRTSINGTPSVSIVGDLNIQKEKEDYIYRIVDLNAASNIPVASTDLLFLGGNTIVASTIEQKDNTLFLGDITTKSNEDDYTELREQLKSERESESLPLTFFNRPVEMAKYSNADYGYAPNMSASSKSRGFKYLEHYRFGLQFQNEVGEWGSVVWIGDKQNEECFPNQINQNLTYYDTIENDNVINNLYNSSEYIEYNTLSAIRYTPTDGVKSILSTFKNATKYRLVMAEHSNQTRTIKTQGFVMPTVFNLKQRSSETCYGSPIWSYGALNNKQHLHNVDFSKYEDVESFKVNPTQQLDSALYKDVSDKDSEDNITNLKFSYLPTATLGSIADGEGNYYLKEIELSIIVFRGTLDQIRAGKADYLGFLGKESLADGVAIGGPSLVQDYFQYNITPIKSAYDSSNTSRMITYTRTTTRLAGKRKNTFNELLAEISAKTWDSYRESTEESLVDYMSGQIVNSEELPTADELRENSGASKDYSTTKTILRHGVAVDKEANTITEHENEYFIDANLCNLWTPDIDNLTTGDYNVRLVGSVNTVNTISDYDITVENNVIEATVYTQADFNFNHFKWGKSLTDTTEANQYNTGISSFLLWPGISNLMWVYPWNQQDFLNGTNFKLKTKTFGNFWKCDTTYVDNKNIIDYGKIKSHKSEEDITSMDLNLYYGKHQNVLFPKTPQRVYLNNQSILKDSSFEEIVAEIRNNNNNLTSIDNPTRGTVTIKYSSTPHMVFKLPISSGYPDVLPLYEQDNSEDSIFYNKNATIWEDVIYPIGEDISNPSGTVTKTSASAEDILHKSKIKSNSFIAELYTSYDEDSFMGGTSENALELNTFIPISDATLIGEPIYGFEGDTYYQQWDCLRIYPTSEDDVNKMVDVVSVSIESYTNLDGDTRKARGRADVINIRPDNMVNQINPVYSQSNNYITSNILDEKFEDSTHPLQYWWSLTKVPNSDIDTWTGVNLTNVAELDGDKGPLNKIKRWNNQLYAFQDKAIAMINFNNQTTIATQEGLPVEIQNSDMVNGHYYITTNNGCKNKWSIVESPDGLYFIDSYNKAINILGNGIKSLSMVNLFQDWIEKHEIGNIWSSEYKNGKAFKSFYDPIHKDVYFANGEDCLCYNELLEQFVSFYDYEKLEHMVMLNNSIYGISDGTIYRMFEGSDYCNLFGKQCDYYMQYKINNEPFIDKTWTNLEYRADIFDRGNIQTNEFDTNDIVNNETFDSLKVWNEYQNGELDLTKVRFGYLKDAKPKFRIWRTNIPRADKTDSNKYGLDRIRNPWIMLELKKENDTNLRMEFHDLIIKYVI